MVYKFCNYNSRRNLFISRIIKKTDAQRAPATVIASQMRRDAEDSVPQKPPYSAYVFCCGRFKKSFRFGLDSRISLSATSAMNSPLVGLSFFV